MAYGSEEGAYSEMASRRLHREQEDRKREIDKEFIRARVLAEVLVEIDDIEFFDDLIWEEDGATAIPLVRRDHLLALFDKGGPLDPDTTHGKDQPCESK